jgi:hypothetical protein
MGKIKVYSSIQIAVSTFFGGPATAAYALWRNFQAVNNSGAAKLTLVGGVIATIVVLFAWPFIPEAVPTLAIPLAYTAAAWLIAERYQFAIAPPLPPDHYEFHSNWNAFGIAVAGFVILMLGIVGWLVALVISTTSR